MRFHRLWLDLNEVICDHSLPPGSQGLHLSAALLSIRHSSRKGPGLVIMHHSDDYWGHCGGCLWSSRHAFQDTQTSEGKV